MNNLLNKYEAIEAALAQAGLNAEDFNLISCRVNGVFYEIELCGNWMHYNCFVGMVTGELQGLDYEPCIILEVIEGENCAELLEANAARYAA